MEIQRRAVLVVFAVLLAVSAAYAAEHKYSTAKIVDVQNKTRDKVNMYLVNTPVTTEVPYFEITVRLSQTDYVAEFTPRHEDEQLPAEWTAGSDVSARLEKHYLFLKRSDGTELRWTITKRKPVKDEQK
jgi:hypothetical protein